MRHGRKIVATSESENNMIKSMTGFGRGEVSKGQRKITVEMKAVNHRYLDVNIKMPKKLNFFDASIRNGVYQCVIWDETKHDYALEFCFIL